MDTVASRTPGGVWSRVRAWRVELALFVVATACITTALVLEDRRYDTDWTRRYWRDPSRLDATLFTARVEFVGGHPRIRPGSVTLKKTMGARLWEVEHTSDDRVLWPAAKLLTVICAARRRSSLPRWSTLGDYHIVHRDGATWLRVESGVVSRSPSGVRWWVRLGDSHAVGYPFIDTAMQFTRGRGETRDWIDLGSIPIGLLSVNNAWNAADIDAWRDAVRESFARAARDAAARGGVRPRMTHVAALALLLDARAAADPLVELAEMSAPVEYGRKTSRAIPGALFALRPETRPDGRAEFEYLVNQFPNPVRVAAWIADDDERPAEVREAAREMTLAARVPVSRFAESERWMPWSLILTLAVPFGLALCGARPRVVAGVRPRDVAAFATLLLGAGVGVPLLGPITTASLALLGAAVVLAVMLGDARQSRATWVPVAIAAVAALLPVATYVASPLLDAGARLMLFLALARLSVLEPRRPARAISEAPPRRPARVRVAAIAELVVATSVAGVWMAAVLMNGAWGVPEFSLVRATLAAGILAILSLGVLVSGRRLARRRRRVGQVASVAIAWGLVTHASVVLTALLAPQSHAFIGYLAEASTVSAAVVLALAVVQLARGATYG